MTLSSRVCSETVAEKERDLGLKVILLVQLSLKAEFDIRLKVSV